MTDVLEQIRHQVALPPAGPHLAPTPGAERRARGDLRRQIARLERELGELFASAFPRQGIEWRVGTVGGPRVLTTGELERVRDALQWRLRDARAEIAARVEVEERNRARLEEMIAAPERHRWLQVSNLDIGEPGCRHWHSRPRWGVLGMLRGWWRVRVSSGCPLAGGERPFSLRSDLSSASKKKRRKRRPRQPAPPAAAPGGAEGAGPAATGERPSASGRQASARRRAAAADERPPAPWGAFPLVELVVLAGIGMIVAGLIVGFDESRGQTLAVTGLALASLAGLELSVREHFAGFRSHTTLLAGVAAAATLGILYYVAEAAWITTLGASAVVGLGAAYLLVRVFRSASGGRSVKLR